MKSENGKLILVLTFDYALLKLSFPLSPLTFQFVLYHEAYII